VSDREQESLALFEVWDNDEVGLVLQDFLSMKLSVERRLNDLRDVALQEEKDYHQLIIAEKEASE